MTNVETLWLDSARGTRAPNPEIRAAVQYWVVVTRPPLAEEILAELSPLPDVPPDTAGLLLRDALNKALADFRIPPAVEYRGGKLALATPAEETLVDALFYTAWMKLLNAALFPPPPLGWKVCPRCNESFAPQRSTAVYCSTRCRMAAHKKKHRAAAS